MSGKVCFISEKHQKKSIAGYKRSLSHEQLIEDSIGFGFQDVVRDFPEKNPSHLARTLSEMASNGMLSKISRDTR
jgi:hypothetical protein